MSPNSSPSINRKLSKHTTFLGTNKLRVVVLATLALVLVLLVLLLLVLSIIRLCRRRFKPFDPVSRLSKNDPSKDLSCPSSLDRKLLSRRITEIEMHIAKLRDHRVELIPLDNDPNNEHVTHYSDAWRVRRFSFKEIEAATNGFANENIVENGDRVVTYRGVLIGTTTARVAVKRLISTSCREDDFEVEMELMGHARHKNLAKLLGYCLEGGFRMVITEYVDNGSLHRWLHGCHEQVSPLTWSVRLDIIQGIAKGLAYLHEDSEPKIVHQDLKSSNVLLDRHWSPKISDLGIANLSGYVAGEFAYSNGCSNEWTNVYCFGVLVMEIVSGRPPVDHSQPQIYLIDWLKSMVSDQKIMYVVDPKLAEIPPSWELKRVVLLALRCVDPDRKHRPTMGEIIHMLEPRDLLLDDECSISRSTSTQWSHLQEGLTYSSLDETEFIRGIKVHYERSFPKLVVHPFYDNMPSSELNSILIPSTLHCNTIIPETIYENPRFVYCSKNLLGNRCL